MPRTRHSHALAAAHADESGAKEGKKRLCSLHTAAPHLQKLGDCVSSLLGHGSWSGSPVPGKVSVFIDSVARTFLDFLVLRGPLAVALVGYGRFLRISDFTVASLPQTQPPNAHLPCSRRAPLSFEDPILSALHFHVLIYFSRHSSLSFHQLPHFRFITFVNTVTGTSPPPANFNTNPIPTLHKTLSYARSRLSVSPTSVHQLSASRPSSSSPIHLVRTISCPSSQHLFSLLAVATHYRREYLPVTSSAQQ